MELLQPKKQNPPRRRELFRNGEEPENVKSGKLTFSENLNRCNPYFWGQKFFALNCSSLLTG